MLFIGVLSFGLFVYWLDCLLILCYFQLFLTKLIFFEFVILSNSDFVYASQLLFLLSFNTLIFQIMLTLLI